MMLSILDSIEFVFNEMTIPESILKLNEELDFIVLKAYDLLNQSLVLKKKNPYSTLSWNQTTKCL